MWTALSLFGSFIRNGNPSDASKTAQHSSLRRFLQSSVVRKIHPEKDAIWRRFIHRKRQELAWVSSFSPAACLCRSLLLSAGVKVESFSFSFSPSIQTSTDWKPSVQCATIFSLALYHARVVKLLQQLAGSSLPE